MTPLQAKAIYVSILILYLLGLFVYNGYCHCEGGVLMVGDKNLLVFEREATCIYEIGHGMFTGPLSEYCYTNPFVEWW